MAKVNQLLAVQPDGSYRFVDNSFSGIKDGLNGAVFDFLCLDDDLGVYVDDEGMLNGGVLNVPASLLMCRALWGPVVVCHGKADPDGNTLPPDVEVLRQAAALARTWEHIRRDAIRLGQDIDHVANEATIPPPRIIHLDDDEFERYLTDRILPDRDDS